MRSCFSDSHETRFIFTLKMAENYVGWFLRHLSYKIMKLMAHELLYRYKQNY